jgi:hypothetical protein
MGNEQSSPHGTGRNEIPTTNLRKNHDHRKIPYKTEEDAEQARKEMISKKKTDAEKLVIYKNTKTEKYHLGRPKEKNDGAGNSETKKCHLGRPQETNDGGGGGGLLLAGLALAVMAGVAIQDKHNREEREKEQQRR